MIRLGTTALVVLAVFALPSPWFPLSGSSPLEAQSRERSLFVSVVDSSGKPVPDLGSSDFDVKEDKVSREVLHVTMAEEPMQIAMLVDTSQAARDDVPRIRQALPAFVTALAKDNVSETSGTVRRRNEIAIVGIGERPTILSEYSSNPEVVKKGIDRIWALRGSGMYLLDAIDEVSRGLERRESPRPVIVVVATEGPDFSNRSHEQALGPLHTLGAALYALSLGEPDTGISRESRERAMVLDEGPRTTGGYHLQLLTSLGLDATLKLLADQLNHEYKVTYARPESLIPPEHVTVSAKKPGLVARGTPVGQEGRK